MKKWTGVITLTAIMCLIWQYAADKYNFLRMLISSPSRICSFMIENSSSLLTDLFHTLFVAVVGLVLSILLGASAAFLGLRVRSAGNFFEGFSTIAQAIPLVVFAPFFVILFGVGYSSKIALAMIISVFPILIGTLGAIKSAQKEFSELLDFYEFSFMQRVWKVYVPYSMPNILSTIRIGAGLAILGAVIAEFTGSAKGLGKNVFLGTVRLEPELMMSSLILTSLLGILVHLTLVRLENSYSWWR